MKTSMDEDGAGITPREISEWCESRGFGVTLFEHSNIGQTNEEAARVLEVPIKCVLKSIVFQANPGGQFGVIQQGSNRIDLLKVRTVLKTGKPSLIPSGILLKSLRVVPGTISPFLFAMNGMRAVVDSRVLMVDEVIATAGSPTQSIRFSPSIFLRLDYEVADVTEAKGKTR